MPHSAFEAHCSLQLTTSIPPTAGVGEGEGLVLGEGEGFVDGEGDGETAGVSVGSSTTS